MQALQTILEKKIVAIVRGAKPADVVPIAYALLKGGVELIEVTINSPDAIEVIRGLSNEMENKMLVGAGTVLDPGTAKKALEAGARFIISPIVDIPTIKITRESGAVSIPGAYTPTEIYNAFQAGGQIIKVFPAAAGASFIKDIRGPLPQIPLMPTGGVHLDNIRSFKEAGAVAFGVATALVDTSVDISSAYLSELTAKASRFVSAIK